MEKKLEDIGRPANTVHGNRCPGTVIMDYFQQGKMVGAAKNLATDSGKITISCSCLQRK